MTGLEPAKRPGRHTRLERSFTAAVCAGTATPAQERWLLDNPGWLCREDNGPEIHRLIQEAL